MYTLKTSLIPYPQSVVCAGYDVSLGLPAAPNFDLVTEDNTSEIYIEAKAYLEKAFLEKFCIECCQNRSNAYKIILSVDPNAPSLADAQKKEAYSIEITEHEARLCGYDAAGAYYAAITFSQLLFEEHGKILIPAISIVDYPSFERRGNFVECRFGTEFMTRENWFEAIDYFASMKNNQLTVGVYGCWTEQYDAEVSQYLYLPIQKYPELKTPKSVRYYSARDQKWVSRKNILPTMFKEDYFGEIIAYGKKKNVTVKPLFNSLGHNRLLPSVFPEISAKREDGTPSGFGFCTRSPRTEEILFDIYDEIIDRYLVPNGIDSIQIGMDEVGAPYICHCPLCRDSSHEEIMVEFIIKLCQHLQGRGMKHIYVYHDMLYNSFNCVNEQLKQRFTDAGIYDNVILDWWTYEDPKHLFWDKAEGVNGLFRSTIKPFTGYYHWAIPTESNPNIRACATIAREKGFEGIEAYSSFEYCYDKNYFCLAEAAWNTDAVMNEEDFDARYAKFRFPRSAERAKQALAAMSLAMRDETEKSYMNSACERLEYYFYCYHRGQPLTRKPFPGAVFENYLIKERDRFKNYLAMLYNTSGTAIEFFERESLDRGFFNDVWLLTAKHYRALSDEYTVLLSLHDQSAARALDPIRAIEELDRLLVQREILMNLAETVRFPAAQYTYLRNMSVFRQVLIDLRDGIAKALQNGDSPTVDLVNTDATQTPLLNLVR